MHQQLRLLAKEYGIENIDQAVLDQLLNISTEFAKDIEEKYLQTYYETTGEVPQGNQKSFKPKQS